MMPSEDRLPQKVNLKKFLSEGGPVFSVKDQDQELQLGWNQKLQQQHLVPEQEHEHDLEITLGVSRPQLQQLQKGQH